MRFIAKLFVAGIFVTGLLNPAGAQSVGAGNTLMAYSTAFFGGIVAAVLNYYERTR